MERASKLTFSGFFETRETDFFLVLAARVRSSCEEGPGQSALQSASHIPQLDVKELKIKLVKRNGRGHLKVLLVSLFSFAVLEGAMPKLQVISQSAGWLVGWLVIWQNSFSVCSLVSWLSN